MNLTKLTWQKEFKLTTGLWPGNETAFHHHGTQHQ